MKVPTVVIAQNWNAFDYWCSRNGISPTDRVAAIPLISYTDRYRLSGKDLTGARVVKVGTINEFNLSAFTKELNARGVTF